MTSSEPPCGKRERHKGYVMAREHRPRRLQIARNARECATRACVLAAAAFGDLGGGPGGSGMEATAEWLAGFN